MAESTKNDVVLGMKGKFGKMFVFKQVAGKTIAARAPGPSTAEPTPAQLAQRARFQQAILYGQSVVAAPDVKKQYDAAAPEGRSGFTVAVADFMHAPNISQIDLTTYSGQVGDKIRLQVTDDFKVKSVKVTIENGDGSLVEEGNAVQVGDGPEWVYTATTANGSIDGDKITVSATDNPANLTTQGTIVQ